MIVLQLFIIGVLMKETKETQNLRLFRLFQILLHHTFIIVYSTLTNSEVS